MEEWRIGPIFHIDKGIVSRSAGGNTTIEPTEVTLWQYWNGTQWLDDPNISLRLEYLPIPG